MSGLVTAILLIVTFLVLALAIRFAGRRARWASPRETTDRHDNDQTSCSTT